MPIAFKIVRTSSKFWLWLCCIMLKHNLLSGNQDAAGTGGGPCSIKKSLAALSPDRKSIVATRRINKGPTVELFPVGLFITPIARSRLAIRMLDIIVTMVYSRSPLKNGK
jgi:hypothetical protein